MNRLGIFGGTFNPPHNGHVSFAHVATKELGFEKLLFVPSRMPPHKTVIEGESPDRLRMTEMLVKMSPLYELSDKEFHREGPSYTIDTLLELRSEYPDAKFFLLVGGDLLPTVHLWHRWESIMEMTTIVVMKREGLPHDNDLPAGARVHVLDVAEMNISSRDVREKIRQGLPVDRLVPSEVEEYIRRNNLYHSITRSKNA